ncbi:cilia- and flagella-associated protein 410 isoform X3 [Rhineura floridana]|uniref:cilia- and flagella-associated protein 410 isoform X3 n=1 Tax=Rhineura floridana TaxID=261503 RepID=UPI002AC894CD|nr:cilia- and flagella-associated protein 410 isoform X3 [Rhineura floridana]
MAILKIVWRFAKVGSRISDISVCRELPSIEVITFSANNISDLEPMNQCQNLTELYLRRNSIASLRELFHLKKLPRLRILWLSENPCCGSDPHHYRMTVLRNLPSLQKLDNQMVTEDELSHALLEGEEITAPPAKLDVENSCQNFTTESSVMESTVENENEVMNFSLEETNKIREQLGMKPVVPREKFVSFSPSKEVDGNRKKLHCDLFILYAYYCCPLVQKQQDTGPKYPKPRIGSLQPVDLIRPPRPQLLAQPATVFLASHALRPPT